MDICLRVLNELNKSRFDSYTVSGTVYWSYPTLPFGIVACSFVPTTFLEIAVSNNNDFISSISTKVALSGNDKRK